MNSFKTALVLCVLSGGLFFIMTDCAESQSSKQVPVTAHMIGHHHIDLIWLWPWEESVEVTRATWQSVLDRMDENPDIRFLQNSAAAYKWIEDVDPVMFEKIKARVKEGRWVIVGGWWVEPDCNVPSGEAFVRQGLYGKRYFKDKFGVETDISLNPDSFGHNWMLPQILRKMRYSKYMFMRPNHNENGDVPADVFWWESPDGSRVLTYRIYVYGTWGDSKEALNRAFTEEKKYLNDGVNDILVFYGVGNHGGVQTKKLISSIREMQVESNDPDIIFSDPVEFFKKVEASGVDFPVYKNDLQHHAQGCYSTIASIKKMNRENENFLCTAEKFSVVANNLVNRPYPKENLLNGWRKVLFNQFHDILPGSSIQSAYTDVIAWHGQARMIAREAINGAEQSVGANINTAAKEGIPIILWNPHAFDVTAPAEVELFVKEGDMPFHLGPVVDSDGKQVPCQFTRAECRATGDDRQRLIVYASVPSMGYKTLWLQADANPVKAETTLSLKDKTDFVVMENNHLKAVIDKKTGYITGLEYKDTGSVIVNQPCAVPVAIEDSSDTWSHDVMAFKKVIGKFGNAKVTVKENGPVRICVEVKSYYDKSSFIQEFMLYRDEARIEVRATVDWNEKLTMFKMQFPLNASTTRSFYSIPFGFIERKPDGNENPGGPYLVIEGKNDKGATVGLALLNDCKYGFDVDKNIMNMTIQRSPVFAHHMPYPLKPGEEYLYMDQGRHQFKYALVPFTGEWSRAATEKAANLLNVPLTALQDYRHEGKLSQSNSFVKIDADNVILTAMKQHEDSDDIIVRVHEADGKKTQTSVSIPQIGKVWKGTMNPFEIKTLRFPVKSGECYEIDMIEWDAMN